MGGFRRPWFVAGGWALDLYLGRWTRPHDDIDVAILREDQQAVRSHLAGWTFEEVVAGERRAWREGEDLDLPVHETYAHRSGGDPLEIEILLNEASEGLWRYRRDTRVSKPLAEIGLPGVDGIPVLSPDIVLLYKAKAPGPTAEQDFRSARDALRPARRRWLREALEVAHPGHPWIRAL